MSEYVHLLKCCVYACKYDDADCPVASRRSLPFYKCERCTCIEMNSSLLADPKSLLEALLWWNSLSASDRVRVYFEQTGESPWEQA